MAPRVDLKIQQGETWEHVLTYRDQSGQGVDLTGYSARLNIGKSFSTETDVFLSTQSEERTGAIVLDDQGNISMTIAAEKTSDILDDLAFVRAFSEEPVEAERFVKFIYDLTLTAPSGKKTRAFLGFVIIEREVET